MLRKPLRCLIGSATLSALLAVSPLIGHGADRTKPPRVGPRRNVPAARSDFKVQTGTPKLPDLRVTAFAVQQPKYVGSKLIVNFTMVVKNTGDKPTGSHFFNVIRLGGKAGWSGRSEALDPEGSHRINDAVEISDPGRQWAGKTFRLVARCDARLVAGDTSVPAWALVKESNEQNNRRKSVELTAPTSPGLTTKQAATGARPAPRRTGRTRPAPSQLGTNPTPTRATTINESGPRRTVEIWVNREIPVNGEAPWGLLTGLLDERIKQFVRNQNVPGMTVAITKDERLVYSRAFGYANLDEQIEMTTNHRSRIGSVSKILTTLAIMRLTELQDDFSLDTHVYGFDEVLTSPIPPGEVAFGENNVNPSGWAKDFLAADGVLDDPEYFWAIKTGTPDLDLASGYARLTVRHLLTHTSGFIKPEVPDDAIAGKKWPMREGHLELLRRGLIANEPGTVTHYENHNMGLCGLLIRELSGMTYEEFCRKYILARAGIPHCVIHGTQISWRDSAAHTLKNGRYVTKKVQPYNLDFEISGFAAGHWSATANDMVKLMCATDQSPNRIDVLHRGTLAEMESIPFPNTTGSKKPRAHGWGKGSNGVLAHNGILPNEYSAYIAKYPPRDGSGATGHTGVNIAIAVNCEAGKLSGLAKDLEAMLSELPVPNDLDLF